MNRPMYASVAILRHDLAKTLELISGNALLLARNTSLDPSAAKIVCNILSASNHGVEILRQLPEGEPVSAPATKTS